MSDVDRVITSIRKFRDETKEHLGQNGVSILTFVANVLTHYPPSEDADVTIWEYEVRDLIASIDLSKLDPDGGI